MHEKKKQRRTNEMRPLFSINGIVDGIRNEMYHIPSTQEQNCITTHNLHPV